MSDFIRHIENLIIYYYLFFWKAVDQRPTFVSVHEKLSTIADRVNELDGLIEDKNNDGLLATNTVNNGKRRRRSTYNKKF